MLIRLFYFLLLIMASSLAYSQDFDTTEADELYSLQNYSEAYDLYAKCYEIDTSSMRCLERAALSAYKMGDTPEAKSLLHQLEHIDSSNYTALNQLSIIYDQERNTPKAIKYYTILNRLYPDNALFYRKLGQQYQSAGLLTDAFKFFSEAYKRNPRDMQAIKGISELFIANQQYEEADSIIRVALDMDSLNVNFNLLMAQCQYRQKAYDSTVFYLENIRYEIDLSPYFNKMFGYSYIQIDSFEKSIPYLEKALMDDGSKEYAHYYLATAYEKLENEDYAFHHYQKALEEAISDNVDLYHRNLAKIHNENDRLKKAIEHYQDAYKYGKDPVVLFFLARASDIYYKDKQIAINYYNRYIKSGHTDEAYIKYSKERKRYLKEQLHLKM